LFGGWGRRECELYYKLHMTVRINELVALSVCFVVSIQFVGFNLNKIQCL